MFWKFGGYASISPIDAILDRPEFTIEDLLDENDLLGDIKAHNGKLLDYLRQRDVLERLIDYVIAPKPDPVAVPEKKVSTAEPESASNDDANNERGRSRLLFGRPRASSSATEGSHDEDEIEARRNRYAYVSCEILSSDSWSICEMLMDPSNRDLLHKLWQYIKQPVLLDPLQASYFTKINESLFDKKVEDMVDFLKSEDGAVQHLLRHVDAPMIMDLLLKIITLDRPEGSPGIVEWLYTQNIIPTLLSFLGPKNSWATQTSAGDFIKAIITVSANATQNEQTCIGPNELTRQLVSHPCIDELIGYMLTGGNALTVGVGIVIEVIRKNNSDYDPDVGTEANSIPSSRDPIYLGTLLRMFAENVPSFMKLMSDAPAQKTRLSSTFNEKIEPLGFDRFKTCELMAELLHCSNMGLLNEVGSEDVIAARDAERHRLRREGRLTPNRGEEAVPTSTDLLTMRASQVPMADEGRRLEVTNISAADEDGFEEVTHAVSLGEEDRQRQQQQQQKDGLPLTGVDSASKSFLDKDDDDFVDEPLSSPRLNTQDEELPELGSNNFEEPDLVVAPLSPSKKKSFSSDSQQEETRTVADITSTEDKAEGVAAGSDDFVTEITEPALGKGDDSESSIVFTPTISSLSDSFQAPVSERSVSPSTDLGEQLGNVTIAEGSGVSDKLQEPQVSSTVEEGIQARGIQTDEIRIGPMPSTPDEENEAEAGDESIIVAHRVPENAVGGSTLNANAVAPVVGDFLKTQFVEHRVVPTILSFFFSYPWNNFLHNVVYDVVQQVFNGPMDRGFNPNLAISLFESADITTQIINGQLASEKSQAATRTRMGYMGHLTLIAEEVVKFTERHPPELLSEVVLDKVMSQDWINYVEGPLAETRERDNAVLGGVRPDVGMGNQAAAAGLAAVGLSGLGSSFGLGNTSNTSSALADAGLNGSLDFQGGNDGGIGPFSISAGISSGFHSSSDEEEDDNDDNDEDINDEFRAYTDPLNASASLIPPAIPPPPPPPPPLNIPPSRARLQLAARLAMNKRNAEAATTQESGQVLEDDENGDQGSLGGRGLASSVTVERMRNPFADDEEDEDDDEDDDADDDDDDEGDSALNGNHRGGRVGLGWNRGSWWRSMVRGDHRSAGGGSSSGDKEKFGDGRDSSSDEEDNSGAAGRGTGTNDTGRGDDDDEEFGDFAIAEVSARDDTSGSDKAEDGDSGGAGADSTANSVPSATGGLFFDRDCESVLFKPLAVHPNPASGGGNTTGNNNGGTSMSGLWPFERLRFLSTADADKEGPGEKDDTEVESGIEVNEPEVESEDGHKVSHVTAAKQRTSLEDTDEDEVVV